MARKSKLSEIIGEAQGNTHSERLIRRAYRAGRESVDQGELLAVGWADAKEANNFTKDRWVGVNAERVDRDRIKVEVRRAKT